MLYQFAITPEVFEPSMIPPAGPEAVILIEILRGIADNGLLANLQAGSWQRTVSANCNLAAADPKLRDKLLSCLKVIHDRNRLIRHPLGSTRSDDDDFRWLHWAIERHRSDPAYPFNGIFATNTYIELSEVTDISLVPLHDALNHNCWLRRPKSIRLAKSDVELRKHLAPLLRYAERATLIDPYMSCRKDRFFNTVQHCADLLGKHDGKQQRGVIQIHAGNPLIDTEIAHQESPQTRLDRWEEALKQVVAQWGHRFEVTLWKNRAGGKNFHDRYLITNQCGVSTPGGLDFGEDPTRANLTTWTWLEPSIIEDLLLREFNPKTSPYELLMSPRRVK